MIIIQLEHDSKLNMSVCSIVDQEGVEKMSFFVKGNTRKSRNYYYDKLVDALDDCCADDVTYGATIERG